MRTRLVIPILLVIAATLAGCSPGGLFSGDLMWTPHRQIASQPDQSGDASRAMMGGLLAREVSLTETQATHLLRRLWRDVPEDQRTVRDVRVLFDPDLVYIKVLLRQGVLPGIPSDTALNLVGRLATVDGKLQVAVDRVALGVIPLAPTAALDLLNQALAAALQNLAPAAAGTIVLEQGVLVIRLQ